MSTHLVISIDELWLKGKNKSNYMKAALEHIAAVFKVYHPDKFSYRVQSERLYYSSKLEFSEELITALTKVPGLAYISPCKMLSRSPGIDLENVYAAILEDLKYLEHSSITFRALVKRVDQTFTQSSVYIGREIGHRVITRYPLAKVDLKQAQLVIDVRILPKHVAISTMAKKGAGGLPWGSTGSAVTMLSGGFDSPVASYLMAKRGVKQSFVFFHAYPFVGRDVITKVKSLVKELVKYQRQTHLYIVPFGDIQNLISKHSHEEYRTLFFRKYMFELSNLICEKTKADAIITGDCVGQVSSQTMSNLHLMNQASQRMILRPLIGFNKQDILKLATEIGTHDISTIPHDDACALFASKKPILKPDMAYWNNWEMDKTIKEDLSRVIAKTEVFSVNLQGEFYKKDYFSIDC